MLFDLSPYLPFNAFVLLMMFIFMGICSLGSDNDNGKN